MTPKPTKALLVATFALTGAAVALADFGAPVLIALAVLFSARVAGQIGVLVARPAWLPPRQQWNFIPYPVLLPAQLAILGAMGFLLGVPHGERPELASWLVWLSTVYATAMAVRYLLRMRLRPAERWFGGTIPIVFHLVLAAFLYTLGTAYR